MRIYCLLHLFLLDVRKRNISQDLNTKTTHIQNWYSGQYDLFDTYINNL